MALCTSKVCTHAHIAIIGVKVHAIDACSDLQLLACKIVPCDTYGRVGYIYNQMLLVAFGVTNIPI